MTNPRNLHTYLRKGEFLYSDAQLNEQRKAIQDAQLWHRWLQRGFHYYYQYGIIPSYLTGINTLHELHEAFNTAVERWNRNEQWLAEMEQHNFFMFDTLTKRMAQRLTRFEHGFTPLNRYHDQGKLFTD
jgi:hypothetical protein